MNGSGVRNWGAGRTSRVHSSVGKYRGVHGSARGVGRASTALGGGASQSVEPFVALLAKGGMHGDALEVGRCSVPTHAATLISGGGRDVAEVAGSRTGTPLAVLLVLTTLSVRAELMARRRGRVTRMGTFATVGKFLAFFKSC